MIVSMTGFAAVADELPGATLGVELRSVNHRFLDLTVKLPDELRAQETPLRERIGAELKRGKVECRVTLNRTQPGATALAIDAHRVIELAKAAQQVRTLVADAAPISVTEILRWPGVMVEAIVAIDELHARLHALIDRALVELAQARSREGYKLAQLLSARCTDIEAQVGRVAPRIPAIHAAYLEKLGTRLKEAGLDPNEDRLKQELAFFAAKVDVAEEVARLITHVGEVRRVLAQGGSAGKRLDFLAQELHREANTLGSKSVDAELSQVALELKVAIEQMREQVQNIE
ncbi:MAG TPA: YicC/YloC family endoribonuclease [Casimicrobiaceae bacterium]|nr:YicC/YloC family endoribonuclease [Casimicrobiaceae bacterium]